MTLVKVGGSLLDWPELGLRLQAWLSTCAKPLALIPGGGSTTDVIRLFDHHHRLGEERSHWLALRALTLNAHFLSALLPMAEVAADMSTVDCLWRQNRLPILDPHAFLLADEDQPGALEHSWAAGSDLIAVRLAELLNAKRLVLLKSISLPSAWDWEESGRQGLVDAAFPLRIRANPALEVEMVNLRATDRSGFNEPAG